jgi:tetratricopeptide (TPR) repeat protein
MSVLLRLSIVFVLLGLLPMVQGEDSLQQFWQRWAQAQGMKESAEYQKLWQRGWSSWQQGQYAKAAEGFGQAALAAPDYALPTFYFALTLFAAEQYTASAKTMRRFAGMCHDWPNMPLSFPRLFPNQDEFAKRLSQFDGWLFQENRPLDTYFLFGLLCQFSGDMHKAEAAYRMVLEREPLYREASWMLEMIVGQKIKTAIPGFVELRAGGEKLLGEKQYAKALELWLAAVAEYPAEPSALYQLGYSLAATGYWEQAAAVIRVCLRRHPQALNEQIQLQATWLRKDSTWLSALEEILPQQPQSGDLLFLLGYLYLVLGEVKKAQIAWQYLQQAEADKPEIREIAKYLASPPAVPPATDKKPTVGSDKKKP